ncbi:uncharacterized protein [Euphorbia lathyris]|uniref:uncharacterized protein isoform X2 n=1 Tax=Euphorbia lathyris TaxID=212925 RepID=UPI00331349E7
MDCSDWILFLQGATSKRSHESLGSWTTLELELCCGPADGSVICRLREGLGITNNVAGYRAMILGLKYALEKGYTKIRVQGDSKLGCLQMLRYCRNMILKLFLDIG